MVVAIGVKTPAIAVEGSQISITSLWIFGGVTADIRDNCSAPGMSRDWWHNADVLEDEEQRGS